MFMFGSQSATLKAERGRAGRVEQLGMCDMMDARGQRGGKRDSTSHLMDWQAVPLTARVRKWRAGHFAKLTTLVTSN